MPIYEFRCKDCAKVSEFQMKMSDPAPELCPACGHPALTKIMSLPSFQLKGGGWYSDAYDGKSNRAAGGKDAKAEGSADAGSASTAPAATPAAPPPSSTPSASPSPSPSASPSASNAPGSKN